LGCIMVSAMVTVVFSSTDSKPWYPERTQRTGRQPGVFALGRVAWLSDRDRGRDRRGYPQQPEPQRLPQCQWPGS